MVARLAVAFVIVAISACHGGGGGDNGGTGDSGGSGGADSPVPPTNRPPTAGSAQFATDEDTTLAATLPGSDPDGDPLTYTVVTQPAHGTVSIAAASFTYAPAGNYAGSDEFSYQVSDASTTSAAATVAITVAAVDDAPTLGLDGPRATDEDSVLAGTFAASDLDGDAVAVSVLAQPAHGSLTLGAGSFTYTPKADYFGPDAFQLQASDGKLRSAPAFFAVDVVSINDAPMLEVAGPHATEEDSALAGVFSSSDRDGDTLTVSIVERPGHGSLTLGSGSFTYTPDQDYFGPDQFRLEAHDGNASSPSAAFAIVVLPVNDPPGWPSPVRLTMNEDSTLTRALGAIDPDGDPLTYAILQQPTHGMLTLEGQSFFYRPAVNYFGPDEFRVQANDVQTSSPAATMQIDVAPVNDPPTVFVIPPTRVDARASSTVQVIASDIDDSETTIDVQQFTGPQIDDLVAAADRITFTAPDAAQVSLVGLRVTARDRSGAFASRDAVFDVQPLSTSGLLRTIAGSPSDAGLHLVITGDGYTASEQQKLLTDAIELSRVVLDTPEIAIYRRVWNVHVLTAVSAESGVDAPTEFIFRDTLFDGTMSCGGTDRLLCVSTGDVIAAVVAELAAFTEILVLSNTERYGGSGGTLAVASRHPESALIALHELGHSFARLVDEYVDDELNTGPISPYPEATIPNATAVSDLALVKWRHWFSNPANVPRIDEPGVGLFEGAHYRAQGLYRPTYNSFMRELNQDMGSVNTEAWVMAIYSTVQAVRNVSPQATNVVAQAGVPITLTAEPRFGPPLQSIAWYEDGREIPEAAGQRTLQCCALATGTRSVTVKVREATGIVRSPNPGRAYFEKTWQITFN